MVVGIGGECLQPLGRGVGGERRNRYPARGGIPGAGGVLRSTPGGRTRAILRRGARGRRPRSRGVCRGGGGGRGGGSGGGGLVTRLVGILLSSSHDGVVGGLRAGTEEARQAAAGTVANRPGGVSEPGEGGGEDCLAETVLGLESRKKAFMLS